MPVIREALGLNCNPVQHAPMFTDQQRPGFEAARLLDRWEPECLWFRLIWPSQHPSDLVEHSDRLPVEIAEGVGLELVREQPKQERAAEVLGRRAAHQLAPTHAQTVLIEAAERLDLGRKLDSKGRWGGRTRDRGARKRSRHRQAP